MRLFVAVLPPAPAIAELAAEVHTLHALPGADRLRWMEREHWHFTLAFLREVPEETLPALTERLARAAHRTDPFQIGLRGGGRFRDRELWVGAAGELDVLRRLAERATAAARKADVRMEGPVGRFTPHLTLARSRTARRDGGGPSTVDLRPYAAELHAFDGTPWTVDELTLVRSHLPTSGIPGERPRYEVVGRWPLGAPG
ncbi:RNA 2',3'-cyclic phosphodiesterase [Streptomyces apocyni]|uniref:RNA 2',3'-cyclic phosphodiesterase n=1 Tax=Streptomyces apocyni TaxID=2654677 RepID=UPI0012EA2FC2|nr:RNA 2',3'-cyclic phosphodiesterase [Streptomyces apocyni]